MTTTAYPKPRAVCAMLLLGAEILACNGQTADPHYKNEKHFGLTPDEGPPGSSGSGSAEPTGGGSPALPTRNGQGSGSGSGSRTGSGSGIDSGSGSTVNPDKPLDPNTLVLHRTYKARIDAGSIMLLADDADTPMEPNLIIGAILRPGINSRADDALILKQTLGDGVKLSLLSQELTISASSLDNYMDHPQASRVETIQRQLSDEGCPAVFVCARQTVSTAADGTAKTFCYYDQRGQSILMPAAVASNFTASDYTRYARHFGPYLVKQFDGGEIDCAAPAAEPVAQEAVDLNVTLLTTATPDWTTMRFHVKNVLPVQYEVDFTYSKAGGIDNVTPYIDVTAGVQGAARFLLNEDHRVLVKLTKSIRQGLTGLAVPLMGADGLLLNWEAEICKDDLAVAAGNPNVPSDFCE